MEDLKCIANETFPSIMDHSLASHTNEILDNVTISSNLGLPVAASTEIRQKTQSHDRLYDQSSYMERRLSDPLASSCCVEFKSDLRKKLMLNFQDPAETTECCLMSDKNKPDCLQRKENQSCVDESSTDNQDSPCEIFSPKQLEDLTTKIFTSLEKRSQGHKAVVLEPKQKWLTSETGDNAVTSLSRLIENEKLMSFASMEANSTDDEIGDEEFSNDELEAYFEHLVLPEIDDVDDQDLGEYINAMEVSSDQEKFQIPEVNKEVRTDSPLVSDEELSDFKVEGFDVKDEQFMLPVITRKEGSCMKSSSRAGPNSTADKSHVGIVGDSSQMCRRTTHEACLDVEGYLDRGMQDGKSLKMNAVIESRNDVTNMTNSAFKLDSVYFNCAEDNKDVSEIWHTEERTNSPPKSQVADETHVPLAEVYLSPSAPGRAEQDQCIVVGDPPHNVVYQNEEGRWVTDLAYYTSFNKEEESDHSNISGDFISGSDAIAMIAQDQEDFEREHRFIQEEKMDLSNTSGLGDFSWKSVSNLNPLRTSQTDFSKDAGYLRLTLGEFFGQRSEALGCLGGGGDVKRPSFGYRITSPQKRQPVPLLRRSDISMANSDKQNLQMSDTLPDFSSLGDVEKSTKEESHIVSATFAPGEMDTPCRENTSENHEGRKIEEKQHSDIEPFPLSISTIASAIANASVSAEPSQLAALMMKLSDIHREGTNIPEIGKVTDLSVINQLLSNNTENSPFDIEKYLRRTDETENDSEPENTIKDEGITTDCHKLLCKQESESANAGDLSKNSFNTKCRKEKQHLEKILEENIFRGSHCVISPKQKKEIENTEATSNIGESFHSEKLSRIPGSKTDLFENDNFCSEDSATIPICPNKEKSMPQVKYQHNQNGKILKGNAPCNNEKHVAFENVSPDHKKVVGE